MSRWRDNLHLCDIRHEARRVTVVNTAISDHYGQEAIIRGKLFKKEPKIPKTIRDTRPGNTALLNASLSKEKWDFINSIQPVEEQFKTFNEYLNFHFNTCCPTKTVKIGTKKTQNTWITKGILISREKLFRNQ
ncbi:hypothetical protein J6590_084118 [Homalodisca vitripennis]|nr:hypothetical protein J6590_084118 [Homalodisca vitripennis]